MTDNYGGVESFIMNYYRNMDRSKVNFDFLSFVGDIAYTDEIEALGGTIYKMTGISQNILKFKQDMNIFFGNHANEYCAIWVNYGIGLWSLVYLKYAKKHGMSRRIVHAHNAKNNCSSKLKYVLHYLNRYHIKNYATDFWACSEEAGKWFYYEKIRKESKYRIIRNAIDTQKYKYDEKIRKDVRRKFHWEDKLVIGNVGRIAEQKNPLFSVEIFNEIYKKNKNTICIHIGDGDSIIKEQMNKKIREYGLENAYYLLGIRKDIPELYQAMDALLLPSLHEGLPVVLVEAQTAGLPCFTSTNVSKESQLIENQIEFISLENGAAKWAERVLEKINIFCRTDGSEKVLKAGYDCKKNAEIVMEQILNCIE